MAQPSAIASASADFDGKIAPGIKIEIAPGRSPAAPPRRGRARRPPGRVSPPASIRAGMTPSKRDCLFETRGATRRSTGSPRRPDWTDPAPHRRPGARPETMPEALVTRIAMAGAKAIDRITQTLRGPHHIGAHALAVDSRQNIEIAARRSCCRAYHSSTESKSGVGSSGSRETGRGRGEWTGAAGGRWSGR